MNDDTKFYQVPEAKMEELLAILDSMVSPTISIPNKNSSDVKMLELLQQAYDKRSGDIFEARCILLKIMHRNSPVQ